MSVARERRFRAQQARELARDLRKKERARLLELRRELKLARSAKLERVRELRTLCRAERARLREKRKRLLAELGETRRELRSRSSSCSSELVGARELGGKTVAAARSAYELEREEQRKTRAIRRAWESETSSKPLSTGRERRADSDDEVRGNIPPELVPVFNKVREKMRGTDYMSRTEAFLEWVHNNSATVERMLNESHHDDVAALEREERELARNVKSAARYSPKRKIAALAADLGVPTPPKRSRYTCGLCLTPAPQGGARELIKAGWTVVRKGELGNAHDRALCPACRPVGERGIPGRASSSSSSSKRPKKPRRGRFQILTRDGSEKFLTGYVLGDFAAARGRFNRWDVTHLPTGYGVSFGPLTKADALAKLEQLEADPGSLDGVQRRILADAPNLRDGLAAIRSAGDVPF